MEIHVKESTIIRPAHETPKHCLKNSELDLLVPSIHAPGVYFYRRPNNSSDFFGAGLLKEALSKVLVPYYPMAGRLGRAENGKFTDINCNGEGVLFMEAETTCVIDDLGDFESNTILLKLVPNVDSTKDISSCPLLVTQVTHFKCGGASLGIGVYHTLADATSVFHFINAWAEMTHGISISNFPFIDRTVLEIGVPTFDQINTLKAKSKENYGPTNTINFTRFEILAAHIWRCLCKARGLSNDQVSKLYFPINGRSRLNPPLPSGYFGNVIFPGTSLALSGDIISEPLSSTCERIHKALMRMDDEYLKSALAYLKQLPDVMVLRRGSHTFKCPNLNVSNLCHMCVYDANFGWGRPMFFRPIAVSDGVGFILPSPNNDGSLYLVINLETQRIQLFRKFFYEILV
ncbi:Shikimate O-hydroxycinnamoyltransferase [Citrus sinensis]|uniref:Shikimate O-hydroxycinnamoyltransferase n=1 Tax=Citrus sinensis TaxID=2711 RepID=A0ACB8JC74_CITSI|nr:Shikimate O-hydroxycinnamoyltransferase [Citrus sinensis]